MVDVQFEDHQNGVGQSSQTYQGIGRHAAPHAITRWFAKFGISDEKYISRILIAVAILSLVVTALIYIFQNKKGRIIFDDEHYRAEEALRDASSGNY